MPERRKRRLFGASLGAGLLGAILLALRFAVRPVTKSRVPDTISPAIFRTKVLHTSLGQVVFHESGSGPDLIFVHGICPGASSYEWSKVYPQFTGTHRVIAPDLIGFGESERPDANLFATDYARSLAEFIRGTCDEPATIVASGLGAGITVLLASQHPEVVKQLVLWMPTGLTEMNRQQISLGRRICSMMPLLHRFMYRNYESNRTAIRGWLVAHGFADPTHISEETVDVYTTCAQQSGAEHAVRNLYAGRLNVNLTERLPALTQPVTLICPDAQGELAASLQSLSPKSTLLSAPGLAQLAAVEGPAQITALLQEELKPGPKVIK